MTNRRFYFSTCMAAALVMSFSMSRPAQSQDIIGKTLDCLFGGCDVSDAVDVATDVMIDDEAKSPVQAPAADRGRDSAGKPPAFIGNPDLSRRDKAALQRQMNDRMDEMQSDRDLAMKDLGFSSYENLTSDQMMAVSRRAAEIKTERMARQYGAGNSSNSKSGAKPFGDLAPSTGNRVTDKAVDDILSGKDAGETAKDVGKEIAKEKLREKVPGADILLEGLGGLFGNKSQKNDANVPEEQGDASVSEDSPSDDEKGSGGLFGFLPKPEPPTSGSHAPNSRR